MICGINQETVGNHRKMDIYHLMNYCITKENHYVIAGKTHVILTGLCSSSQTVRHYHRRGEWLDSILIHSGAWMVWSLSSSG